MFLNFSESKVSEGLHTHKQSLGKQISVNTCNTKTLYIFESPDSVNLRTLPTEQLLPSPHQTCADLQIMLHIFCVLLVMIMIRRA